MRPHKFTYTLAAAHLDGYCDAAITNVWTLLNDGPADGCSHPVIVTNNAAVDHRTDHFTIVGTDAEDRPLTETLHGPNVSPGTSTTTAYFKTVTAITSDFTQGGGENMDIGWTALARTPTFPTDTYPTAGPLIGVDLGGTTCNYAVQQTNDAVYDNNPASWQALQAAGTANTINQALVGTSGLRVTVASHTSGVVIVTISQARA